MKFREVTITPWNIDIFYNWVGRSNDIYGNYWIPIDRVHEDDWLHHIQQKTWCTPDISNEIEAALVKVRALKKGEPIKTNGVYCIRSWNGAFFKVGMSTNVFSRIADLRRSAPFETGIVFVAETDEHLNLEQRLHAGLAPYRSNGEWYELDGDADDDIASVKKMMGAVLGEIRVWPGEAFPWKKRNEED